MKTIDEEIKINDQLNPALWDNNELKEDVKEKLLDIVDNFLDGLKEDKINIDVVDVRLLGSNANYNYTDKSDIDLHIVADFSSTPCEQNVMPQLYNAYRSLFSKAYDIKINGYDVELYVEDVNQPARSNGVYSLYTGWISEPKRSEIPEINWEQFELVFDGMEDRYFDVVGEHSGELVDNENINEAFSYTDSTNVNNLTDLDRQYFDYIYSGQSNKAKEILNKLALDWGALSKGNKPLKLYHGTIVDKDRFTKFDAKKGYNVDAIYFTNVPEVAHHFIGNSNYNSINNRSFNDNALTKLLTNAGRDVNKLLDILNNHLYQNYKIESQTNDDGELEYFLVDGDDSYSTTSWLGTKIDDETYVRYEWGNKDKPIKTNLSDKFIYDIERYIYYVNNIGQTYCCYLKMNNPLIIDAKKHPFYEVEFEGKELNTETISYLAKERGYDGVIIKNVLETNYANAKCDDYIVFDANQIKSCDLITCDDNGDIIPPSKRFTTSDDIREDMKEHLRANVNEAYANNIDRDILDTIKNPLDKLYKNTKCSKSAGTMLDYYFYETDKPLKLCLGAIRHKGDESKAKDITHVWVELDGKVKETNFPDGDYERVLVDELLIDRNEDLYNQVEEFLNKPSLREAFTSNVKTLISKLKDYGIEASVDKELYNDYNLTIKDTNTGVTRKVKVSKTVKPTKEYCKYLKDYLSSINENLNESTQEVDSEGNPLTPEQVEFFKNSKVRDSNGRLLVVYHGTSRDFNKFDNNYSSKSGLFGDGFYFAKNKTLATNYGNKIITAYLNIARPFKYYAFDDEEVLAILNKYDENFDKDKVTNLLNDNKFNYDLDILDDIISKVIEKDPYANFSTILNELGYDGIDADDEIIAFYPNQIKSITNKTPSNSDNINEDWLSDANKIETIKQELNQAYDDLMGNDKTRLYRYREWANNSNNDYKEYIYNDLKKNKDKSLRLWYNTYRLRSGDYDLSYNDFLRKPFKLYRATNVDEKDSVSNPFFSYALTKQLAQRFLSGVFNLDNGRTGEIEEIEVTPSQTLGMFPSDEEEIIIPNTTYEKDNQSILDRVNKLIDYANENNVELPYDQEELVDIFKKEGRDKDNLEQQVIAYVDKRKGLKEDKLQERKAIDLTGQQFGELTVIGRDTSKKGKESYWLCKCSCGNETSVARKHLINGDIKSCGHLRSQNGKDHADNFNGMRDRQDKYHTNLEVIRNQTMQPNNTSGVKGVDYHKTRNMWRARVFLNGKEVTKWFKDFYDAVAWRKNAEKQYYDPQVDKAIKNGDLKEALNNYGYHAGDLGKSEGREQQTGGRGTGHFGTGTYFVGNPEKIKNYNDYQYGKGKAPHHIVDFSSYNLYKPSNNYMGYKLHDTLKELNNGYKYYTQYANDYDWFINKGIDAKHTDFEVSDVPEVVSHLNNLLFDYDKIELPSDIDWDTIEDEYTQEDDRLTTELKPKYKDEDGYTEWGKLIDAVETELNKNPKFKAKNDTMYKVLDAISNELGERDLDRYKDIKRLPDKLYDALEHRHSKEEINKALGEVNKHLSDKSGDSLSTIFMKALGYDGVDVRHLNKDGNGWAGLDNTTYGSVIYDVKPETIVEGAIDKK